MVSLLGSLVQSCCGEGGVLQTNVTGMCGAHPQCSGHTGFAPVCCVCFPHLHCSGSRLLCREWPFVACSSSSLVLHKSADSVGPAFCAFPAQAAQAARSLMGALSLGVACLLPSRSQPQFPPMPVRCVHLFPSAAPASVSARASRVRAPCV